jgi:hypothetical protein
LFFFIRIDLLSLALRKSIQKEGLRSTAEEDGKGILGLLAIEWSCETVMEVSVGNPFLLREAVKPSGFKDLHVGSFYSSALRS